MPPHVSNPSAGPRKRFTFPVSLFYTLFLLVCGRLHAQDLTSVWLEGKPDEREKLLSTMQVLIDKTPKKEFDAFDADPNMGTDNPVLKFYDRALDRLLADIPATQVKPGTAVIWYLYNMGFVIKTPEACFGVDIHHRRAEKLEPLLDFIAVTHNHSDHYSLPLMQKMAKNKKPVITNFYPDPAYTKETSFTHTIKGVEVHCGEADHHKKLKKFTMPLEFVCPTGDRKFVFFTSGDCCSHVFLNRKSPVIDLYAIHPRCGMLPVNAVKRLDPAMTFVSHLQELSHDINVWRWSFSDGKTDAAGIRETGHRACIPVWGEKFLWDGEKILGAQK